MYPKVFFYLQDGRGLIACSCLRHDGTHSNAACRTPICAAPRTWTTFSGKCWRPAGMQQWECWRHLQYLRPPYCECPSAPRPCGGDGRPCRRRIRTASVPPLCRPVHAKSRREPSYPTDQRQCDAFTLTRLLPPPPPALRTLPCSVMISTLSISAPLRLCTHTTLSPAASSRVCATGLSLSELHFGEETQIVWPLDWTSNVHCRPLTRLSPNLERSKRETISNSIRNHKAMLRQSHQPRQ